MSENVQFASFDMKPERLRVIFLSLTDRVARVIL